MTLRLVSSTDRVPLPSNKPREGFLKMVAQPKPDDSGARVIVTKVVVEQYAVDGQRKPSDIISSLEQQLGDQFTLKRISIAEPSEGGLMGAHVLKEYDAGGKDLARRSADILDRENKLTVRLKFDGEEVAGFEFKGNGSAKAVIAPQLAALWRDGSIEF
ncbi:hypothetical protein IC232_03895 [Microvirga sp. BT688]|uniref:hypothetical protein n=1 Tax=Microvirga sp. TaxID=1873136 RepID=UPI001689382A|nr:hypothetical protein [Microvirga sp.]MBD2745834.1 hypothetical protein [Microvirga sp.]